jgi:hypothetical protein
MITFIIGAIIGFVAGWYIPQPEFIKNLFKKS